MDENSVYAAVATNNMNYQMFAFNPTTNQRECGIADSDSNDMTLMTTEEMQTISSTSLKFQEGRPEFRQYDACFYLIKTDVTGYTAFKLEAADQVNVYVYGGADRFTATESIVPMNAMPTVGVEYGTDASKGILVVAFPNKDVDTNFSFSYWHQETKPAGSGAMMNALKMTSLLVFAFLTLN